MTPEKYLPIIVAGIYLTTAILHLRKGEHAAFVMWSCYSLANIATVIALSQGMNK